MEPNLSNARPMTLLDLYFAVLRKRGLAIKTAIVLMLLASVVVMLLPKRFDSDAKLFVRLGRGSVSLDPAATTGQTISIQESRETEINSVVDMLESRAVAEQVVRTIGADRILKKYSWIERNIEWLESLLPELPGAATVADNDGPSLTEEEIDEQKDLEAAIKDLQENLQIKSPRKSTTVSISYRGRDPFLAQEINKTVIEAYKDLHIRAYQADGSLEFFEDKFNEQSKLLLESQEELRYAKNEMMIITIQGKQDSLQQQITENQKMQLDVRAELVAAKARVSELQRDMLSLPTEIPSTVTSGIADAGTDTMRSRLYELEIQEQELASKYSDDHPTLQKVRVQLASSRKTYEEQQKERDQSVVASNPVREKQHSELLAARAAMFGLEAKQTVLQQTAEELRDRLEKVNRFEMESDMLQRKIDMARETYQVYARKLEESRINQALDVGSQSNVSIVQEPSLTLKHSSPKRSILFVLAAVMSSVGGIALAVLSDRLQPLLKRSPAPASVPASASSLAVES